MSVHNCKYSLMNVWSVQGAPAVQRLPSLPGQTSDTGCKHCIDAYLEIENKNKEETT